MVKNVLLTFTSTAQLGLFAALVVIIFGWVEKKEKLEDVGRYIFVLLGVYAAWIILSHQIQIPEGALFESSKEARAITFFKATIACAVIAIVAILLKLTKSKYYKHLTILCVVFGILMFFILYNLQQA